MTAASQRKAITILMPAIFAAWGIAEFFRSYAYVTNEDWYAYSDIANLYLHGDWGFAVNSYWPPLLSWLLAIPHSFLSSPFGRITAGHVIQLTMYLITLGLLAAAIPRTWRVAKKTTGVNLPDNCETAFLLLAWLVSGALLVGTLPVAFFSPDTVLAVLYVLVYLLLLDILEKENASAGRCVLLGIICGLGYYAKSIFLPWGAVCLLVAALASKTGLWKNLRNACIGGVVMLALAAPFVAAISRQQGRLTIGDSGTFNYALSVSMAEQGLGHESQLSAKEGAEKFDPGEIVFTPASYPYHFPALVKRADAQTAKPHASPAVMLKVFLRNCRWTVHGKYWLPFFVVMAVAVAVGLWKHGRALATSRYALLTLPPLAGWGAYALIFCLPRYVNVFLLLLFLLLAPFMVCSINRKALIGAFLLVTLIALPFQWTEVRDSCSETRQAGNALSMAARARDAGLGDFCAVRYKELFKSTGGETWVMYTDARCRASVDHMDGFVAMSAETRARFVRALLDHGVRHIVYIEPPAEVINKTWVPLGLERYCEKLQDGSPSQ